MAVKRMAGLAAGFAAAGLAIPLMAQQVPAPSQSTPVPSQTAPGVAPGAPSMVPRRLPAPGQAPDLNRSQGESQAASPDQQPGPSQDAPAQQPAPSISGPQRRFTPSPSSPGGMVSLNFNRADLVEIIHIIAQQLRLTYTIDPEVKGSVTINSAEPLRPEDLLPIFHQVLRMNGAVAVRTGNLYHIMPIKDGKGLARPAGRTKEDSFALQVIPVRFFAAAEMKRVLTPFLQPGGEIIDNPRGNFLIVMDLPTNIQRLVEIADLIDVQVFAGTRMEIYQPKVASAEELAQEMTKVMQSFASSAPQAESFTAQFIALPRINQLLVISHSEAAWTYAKRWLDRIDIIAEGPGRRVFIYPVENGKATELADVLSQALGQPSSGRRDTTRTLQDLHRSSSSGTSTSSGRTSTGSSVPFGQQTQPLGAYATIPVPGQVPTPGLAAPQPGVPQVPGVARPTPQTPQTPQAQQQQEQLRIVPDPATNSLIIYGTVQEFQNIKNILKELDAVPRQVLIDAMILQIDLKDTEDFGVDYEILRKPRQTIFGRTFGSSAAITTLGKLFPSAATGFPGVGGLSGIVGDDTVSAMIRALATDSRVKVVSAPSVLASDNRPARIQVGTEEPIPTGTITAAVGATTPSSSTTIQYRNTGRILTIIPQVNSQGLVNLQIKAEVSARGENVSFGTSESFPAFNTQDAETTAVVHDGETLVIGGLIGERKSKGRSGIPYLMDIPVIGRFFGTTSDATDRTELIMLITPRVIRNRNEAQNVTADFKSKLSIVRSELERMERERAKSPRKLPPAVEPKANEEKPPPQSKLGPRTGSSIAPTSAIMPSNFAAGPMPPASSATFESIVPTSENRSGTASLEQVVAGTRTESAPAEPAYLLSLVRQQMPAPSGAVSLPEKKLDGRPTRQWAVQVASFADRKDADTIVEQLRKEGYDAYVMTAQTAGSTWHRVRVGKFAELSAAKLLKETLLKTPQFKHAYVAVR